MQHTVEYDIHSKVCTIQVSGLHKRPEDSHELIRIASDFAAKQGCSRFILDMREASIVGDTMDAYETAVDPEIHGFSRSFRVALVYTAITENEKLIENVGVNRGALFFRVFDDIDEARIWITSE